MVGSGGYILEGSWWWWLVVGLFWIVVDRGEFALGGGFIWRSAG